VSGATSESGQREVTDESLANRRIAEMLGRLVHQCVECLTPGGVNDERVVSEILDDRPETYLGGGERHLVESFCHLTRMRVAEESKGDVPVLLGDESNSGLVLAGQQRQVSTCLWGWPNGHEETGQSHDLYS